MSGISAVSRSIWAGSSSREMEMAGRVLKQLEEQGKLKARGKTIVVFEPD